MIFNITWSLLLDAIVTGVFDMVTGLVIAESIKGGPLLDPFLVTSLIC